MLRVIKVGGSLLDWPLLSSALKHWLDEQRPGTNVLICGGGKLVDRVRQLDRMFSLRPEEAEVLALHCMAMNAGLLASLLGRLNVITDCADLQAKIKRRRTRQLLVFDCRELLGRREATLDAPPLPHDWSVTSDSIAAWLAELLRADELVLLKSADAPFGSFQELAAAGYVDAFFPEAAKRLAAVRFVNLRAKTRPTATCPVGS
jgi:aspartokinase-like uncharacterized kinase